MRKSRLADGVSATVGAVASAIGMEHGGNYQGVKEHQAAAATTVEHVSRLFSPCFGKSNRDTFMTSARTEDHSGPLTVRNS
jgi:hypothetical protein